MAEQGTGIPLSRSFNDDSSNQHAPYIDGSNGRGSSFHRQLPPSTIPLHHQVTEPPSKKPRGRPPGSKNKPKPPIVITQENDEAMKPVVIEVGPGKDVMEAVIQYAHSHNAGITMFTASGSISQLTLCPPFSYSTPAFTLHGPFTLFAINGSYINSPSHPSLVDGASLSSSSNPNPLSSFMITFTSAQGQVFSGIIGGKVVSANKVVVVATLLKNLEFQQFGCVNENEGEEGDSFNN